MNIKHLSNTIYHHQFSIFSIIAALLLSFIYGIAVMQYHIPPYTLLKKIKQSVMAHMIEDKNLIDLAFTDPLIEEEKIFEPIDSLDDIKKMNELMFLPVEHFFDAYKHITITDYTFINDDNNNILTLTYSLGNKTYTAYAYAPAAVTTEKPAALIIPGSGINQSFEIHEGKNTNYQSNIIDILGEEYQKFILIKPNGSPLAIHNEKYKLNKDFIINWQINTGGSYSAHYIANSLAITKFLQNRYSYTMIVGLSQGGAAALINSLQSEPDATIVASGFSIMDYDILWSGHDQIIIPGLYQKLNADYIHKRISKMKTKFLFTYGKEEVGTYKEESIEQKTCTFFKELSHVTCGIHDGGHEYPAQMIQKFLMPI